MYEVTSFSAAGVPQNDLRGVLADHLALDEARLFRRLLVLRCGALACVAAAAGLFVHGFSIFARSFSVGLCLAPPAWAWGVELWRARRLARQLRRIDSRKKVIKSS